MANSQYQPYQIDISFWKGFTSYDACGIIGKYKPVAKYYGLTKTGRLGRKVISSLLKALLIVYCVLNTLLCGLFIILEPHKLFSLVSLPRLKFHLHLNLKVLLFVD